MSRSPVRSVVALRGYAADDSWNGDRATGLLVDSDTVMVPAPPSWLLDASANFAAIVLGLPLADGAPIELINPTQVVVLSVRGARPAADQPVVGYVQLARASSYPTFTLTARAKAEFDVTLESCQGDYWAALRHTGLVADGLQEQPPARFLQGIAAPATQLLGGDLVAPVPRRDRTHASLGELNAANCCPTVRACCSRLFSAE